MTTITHAPSTEAVNNQTSAKPVKIIVGMVGAIFTSWVMVNTFLALAYYPQWFLNNRILMVLVGMVVGIGGRGSFPTSSCCQRLRSSR
mgnify:CR=1 FL=1